MPVQVRHQPRANLLPWWTALELTIGAPDAPATKFFFSLPFVCLLLLFVPTPVLHIDPALCLLLTLLRGFPRKLFLVVFLLPGLVAESDLRGRDLLPVETNRYPCRDDDQPSSNPEHEPRW